MNREELKAVLVELLTGVAPDVDPAALLPGVDFRDQFDFDSMDTLNFAIAMHQSLGVNVPETDYAKLASLDKCVAYLELRQG
ncbi:MAG: phosphopantetheine-binding protein [Steroidobacteraceae bacterium]|jgi:acyl carrier protein|nr:phosphopantetheine-binding protein [Steroidobacteraceae bacterium]